MDATSEHGGARRASVLAWMRLARVFQKVYRGSGKQLRAWNLSVAQFDMLAQAGSAEGLTQQELADRLLVTKGNISQLLDKMEQADLIERRARGRACGIYLTDQGRRLFDAVVPAHEAFIHERFAVLAQPDLAQLITSLRTLDRSLQR